MRDGCPFCDYAGPSEVWSRWTMPIGPDTLNVLVFEPLNPVVDGHFIVVPAVHVEDPLADPAITGAVMEVAAREAYWRAPSCNIIASAGAAATQTVMHFHAHVVPRRAGDGLRLPWSA